VLSGALSPKGMLRTAVAARTYRHITEGALMSPAGAPGTWLVGKGGTYLK
jgi:hypothetical protein